MAQTPQITSYVQEIATLARRKATHFDLHPTSAEMSEIAAEMDLTILRKLRFTGSLAPMGREDWILKATLGATAVQPCAITAEPVTTRIDAPVERRFVSEIPQPDDTAEEDEFGGTAMLDDDTLEPLGREIDLRDVMTEALALALPDYPRAPGAEIGSLQVTEPGKPVMSESDMKPFAGLADLKAKLSAASDDPDKT